MPDQKSKKNFDVYAYGVIAYSTAYMLQKTFPVCGGYAELQKEAANIGGEAANTAMVLAQMGLKVTLEGNWLGSDTRARFVKETLRKKGIDISGIVEKKNHETPREVLFIDAHTKTIFATYGTLLMQKSWTQAKRSAVAKAAVISLDPFFGKESVAIAYYAKELHTPLVTVDCPLESEILACASVVILAEEYIKQTYRSSTAQEIYRHYQKKTQGLIIITCGDKKILYGSARTTMKVCNPYTIKAIDTTGAGDAFRAGIIYGILKKWSIEYSIQFASATAALVCQSYPGVLQSPSFLQVRRFIRSKKFLVPY